MIDQEAVERVKAQTSLSKVVSQRVRLEKRGSRFVGLCPFHKEKTASFHINEERGFYHCFGCKATGDVIRFVRETEGLSFAEALEKLAGPLGIELTTIKTPEERRQRDVARQRRDELYEVNEAAAAFFEQCLERHAFARYAHEELTHRDLSFSRPNMAETLKAFRIGYAPSGWDELASHLKQGGHSLQAAEKAGLIAPRRQGSGYYDRFRHRLMFAVMDLQGRIVAFSGRALAALPEQASSREQVAKYINSPESPIYRKREAMFGLYQARQAARSENLCVVVEGNFDVVSLQARGIANVAAPLGTAFTEEQAALLARLASRVVLLFDSDRAGRKAVHAARESVKASGLTCFVATLPEGKDPDDVIRAAGPEAITRIVAARRSLLEYLIETTLDAGFTRDDPHSRAAKIKEVIALINAEEDPTMRSLAKSHADRVASRLNIMDVTSFRALEQAMTRATSKTAPATLLAMAPPERARSRARPGDIEGAVVAALAAFPALLHDPEIAALLIDCQGQFALAIAQLRAAFTQAAAATPGSLSYEQLEQLPDAYREGTARLLTAQDSLDLAGARSWTLENLQRLHHVQQRRLRDAAVEDLRQAARVGDIDAELRLLQEQARRARQKHGL